MQRNPSLETGVTTSNRKICFKVILHVFGFGIEFLENKDICIFGHFMENGTYRQVDLLRRVWADRLYNVRTVKASTRRIGWL